MAILPIIDSIGPDRFYKAETTAVINTLPFYETEFGHTILDISNHDTNRVLTTHSRDIKINLGSDSGNLSVAVEFEISNGYTYGVDDRSTNTPDAEVEYEYGMDMSSPTTYGIQFVANTIDKTVLALWIDGVEIANPVVDPNTNIATLITETVPRNRLDTDGITEIPDVYAVTTRTIAIDFTGDNPIIRVVNQVNATPQLAEFDVVYGYNKALVLLKPFVPLAMLTTPIGEAIKGALTTLYTDTDVIGKITSYGRTVAVYDDLVDGLQDLATAINTASDVNNESLELLLTTLLTVVNNNTGAIRDIQTNEDVNQRVIYNDEVNDNIYICRAVPGKSKTDAAWRVHKILSDGSRLLTVTDGFDNAIPTLAAAQMLTYFTP